MVKVTETFKAKIWLRWLLGAVVLVVVSGIGYAAYDRLILHPDEYPTHHLRFALPSQWNMHDLTANLTAPYYPADPAWLPQQDIELDSSDEPQGVCVYGESCLEVPIAFVSISDFTANQQPSLIAWLNKDKAMRSSFAYNLNDFQSESFGGQPALCHYFIEDKYDFIDSCFILWDQRVYTFGFGLGPSSAPTFKEDTAQFNSLIKSLEFV
jgi:hypothetical protein